MFWDKQELRICAFKARWKTPLHTVLWPVLASFCAYSCIHVCETHDLMHVCVCVCVCVCMRACMHTCAYAILCVGVCRWSTCVYVSTCFTWIFLQTVVLYHRLFSLCVNIAAFNTFLQTLIVKHFKLLKELYNCYYYLIFFTHGCGRTNQNSGQITLKGTQRKEKVVRRRQPLSLNFQLRPPRWQSETRFVQSTKPSEA